MPWRAIPFHRTITFSYVLKNLDLSVSSGRIRTCTVLILHGSVDSVSPHAHIAEGSLIAPSTAAIHAFKNVEQGLKKVTIFKHWVHFYPLGSDLTCLMSVMMQELGLGSTKLAKGNEVHHCSFLQPSLQQIRAEQQCFACLMMAIESASAG